MLSWYKMRVNWAKDYEDMQAPVSKLLVDFKEGGGLKNNKNCSLKTMGYKW